MNDDLRGLAVHLAARIMDAAKPGTVLVSGTSRELTIGAGIEFVDLGDRAFKGISGKRRVYRARPVQANDDADAAADSDAPGPAGWD